MNYTCKICQEEKDEKNFPHENGKIRRYICWSCRSKREIAQKKLRLLSEFGWKCQCCGETMPQFLTLDHIQGGVEKRGARRENMYEWLKAVKEGFPKDKYQLLCMNCNFAKGHFGVCPHQTGTTPQAEIDKLSITAGTIVVNRHATEAQLRALDAGRHLGPIARWGTPPDSDAEAASLLGITKEQFQQMKEILKSEKNSS